MTNVARRRAISRVMGALTALAAGVIILPLVLIFAFLFYQGSAALNLDFFLHLPKPVGEIGGGMANAIVGTLILIASTRSITRSSASC